MKTANFSNSRFLSLGIQLFSLIHFYIWLAIDQHPFGLPCNCVATNLKRLPPSKKNLNFKRTEEKIMNFFSLKKMKMKLLGFFSFPPSIMLHQHARSSANRIKRENEVNHHLTTVCLLSLSLSIAFFEKSLRFM